MDIPTKSNYIKYKDKNENLFVNKNAILKRFEAVRTETESLIKNLSAEDLCLQGMVEASPPKWHLAHTNWFFEAIILTPHKSNYKVYNKRWNYLFNSYYDFFGERHSREERGILTRPLTSEILKWRKHVDTELKEFIENLINPNLHIFNIIELGLQHEQQHQELLLMDLLDGFSRNPLEPVYSFDFKDIEKNQNYNKNWVEFESGLREIGAIHRDANYSPKKFYFDNETPRHKTFIEPFRFASELVTNISYKHFINDGGYQKPQYWMSEGWHLKDINKWQCPRYWIKNVENNEYEWEFSLNGRKNIEDLKPVRHINWFEADAFARWAGARLPTECEWEIAVESNNIDIMQSHNSLWQWTSSPYSPYPGFKRIDGALGEYNGKFMSSQLVLKGSSYLTPISHQRNTYRNFFYPLNRWMASGIRLAK
tara:strand:- start:3012 stop:4286 length:1275 start_codon:yes stop_codon:yes gene_type:complete